jgi:hypothetical protein
MGFLSALLGLLSGRRGSVCIVDFRHGLAPSTGIYPRELNPADLSLSSDPKCVPLLLMANTVKLSNRGMSELTGKLTCPHNLYL